MANGRYIAVPNNHLAWSKLVGSQRKHASHSADKCSQDFENASLHFGSNHRKGAGRLLPVLSSYSTCLLLKGCFRILNGIQAIYGMTAFLYY